MNHLGRISAVHFVPRRYVFLRCPGGTTGTVLRSCPIHRQRETTRSRRTVPLAPGSGLPGDKEPENRPRGPSPWCPDEPGEGCGAPFWLSYVEVVVILVYNKLRAYTFCLRTVCNELRNSTKSTESREYRCTVLQSILFTKAQDGWCAERRSSPDEVECLCRPRHCSSCIRIF